MRLVATLLLVAAAARAADEDLRKEVEELKRTVAEQAERIDRLQGQGRAADVEAYLQEAQGAALDAGETAGYDGRFFIQTRDGQYRLMFRLYSQARYNWNERDEAPAGERKSTQGWEIARTRVWFDGDLTEHFYFHFRLNINSDSEFKLVNAFLRWKAPGGWVVDVGERWFYLSREDWTLPMDQLTTEFSANDLVFAIGTSRGVQVSHAHDMIRYYFGISDGPFAGGQNFAAATTDFTLTGRFEIQWATTDWSIWDDLTGRRGRPFGIMLGVGVGYADGKSGVGTPPIQSAALVTVDLNVNWDGGQAMIYGTWRFVDPRGEESYANWGVVAQGGHFIAPQHQLYGRYEVASAGDQPGDFDNYNSVTFGWSYFLFADSNVNKISVEFSYLFDALSRTIVPASTGVGFLPSSEGDQWYFRVQAQFGF